MKILSKNTNFVNMPYYRDMVIHWTVLLFIDHLRKVSTEGDLLWVTLAAVLSIIINDAETWNFPPL